MKCPHCGRAHVVAAHTPMTDGKVMNVCPVCSRGWTQDATGNWTSHFATDTELYSSDGKKLLDSAVFHFTDKKWDGQLDPMYYKTRHTLGFVRNT